MGPEVVAEHLERGEIGATAGVRVPEFRVRIPGAGIDFYDSDGAGPVELAARRHIERTRRAPAACTGTDVPGRTSRGDCDRRLEGADASTGAARGIRGDRLIDLGSGRRVGDPERVGRAAWDGVPLVNRRRVGGGASRRRSASPTPSRRSGPRRSRRQRPRVEALHPPAAVTRREHMAGRKRALHFRP